MPEPKRPSRGQRHRHLGSLFLAAGLLLAVGAVMVFPALVATAGPDALSPDTSSCKGPASTPACASKTWDDCFAYRNPALCAEVGRPDIEFWSTEVSEDRQRVVHTKLPPLSEPIDYEKSQSVGVREISPSRFDWLPNMQDEPGQYDPIAIAPDLRGTHEVMYAWVGGDGKVYADYSYFLRKEGDRWVLASWSWHFNEQCEGATERDVECKYFIYPVPWDKWPDDL